jgi:hypothetical protein
MQNVFVILFFISGICIILGIINPKIVIRWGDISNKKRGRVFLYYGTAMFMFFVMVGATGTSSNDDIKFDDYSNDGINKDEVESKSNINTANLEEIDLESVKWNTTDLDVLTNGNLQKAIEVLNSMNDEDIKSKITEVASSDVNKAPWKYYGQIINFSGTAEIVYEYPPGSDFSKVLAKGGECGEIVFITDEGIIIDMLVIGSTGDIGGNDNVEINALPIGRSEVENKLGGSTIQLIVVGKM